MIKAKTINLDDLIGQDPPALISLGECMPQKWFIIVEEDKDKEEVLFSCNVIVGDIDFQQGSV